MPTLKPALKEGPALEAFAAFVGQWIGADPYRAESFSGAKEVMDALNASILDIKTSSVYANDIELSDAGAAAFIFLASRFLQTPPQEPATRIVGAYLAALQQQTKNRFATEKQVGQNPLIGGPRDPRTIFLVCGRDRPSTLEVERWLTRMGLKVKMLETETTEGSPTVPEGLERAATGCGTVVVLATADDYGRLAKTSVANMKPRARQNVILELGLFWGSHGRGRTILLLDERLLDDFPSDANSFMTIRFRDSVKETFDALRSKLQHLGVL